jgi:hypothetical protein
MRITPLNTGSTARTGLKYYSLSIYFYITPCYPTLEAEVAARMTRFAVAVSSLYRISQ